MTKYVKMPTRYWDAYLDDRLEKTKQILGVKAAEYAVGDSDRMHNFNIGLQISQNLSTREDVILGMAMKHWISVQDILAGLRVGTKPDRDRVKEKFGDWINYMMLIEASVLHTIDDLENKLLLDGGLEEGYPSFKPFIGLSINP